MSNFWYSWWILPCLNKAFTTFYNYNEQVRVVLCKTTTWNYHICDESIQMWIFNEPFASEWWRGTNGQTGERMTHWDMFCYENSSLVALLNMPQCVICSPVWRFLPPDRSAANGPFSVFNLTSRRPTHFMTLFSNIVKCEQDGISAK